MVRRVIVARPPTTGELYSLSEGITPECGRCRWTAHRTADQQPGLSGCSWRPTANWRRDADLRFKEGMSWRKGGVHSYSVAA
jgi:hypothetical protein